MTSLNFLLYRLLSFSLKKNDRCYHRKEDMSIFRNEKRETKFIWLPCNLYTKCFEEMRRISVVKSCIKPSILLKTIALNIIAAKTQEL